MYLQLTTLAEITDHTGTELLPQVLLPPAAQQPKGLGNISQSTLQWPMIAIPSKACWKLWTSTLRSTYIGSKQGTRLQQPLGAWLSTYETNRFWNWRLHDDSHIVFRHSPTSATCVGLQTQNRRTLMKFSPTIPTNLQFHRPPVTPIDPTTGYVRQPVPLLAVEPDAKLHQNTFQQFRNSSVMAYFHGKQRYLE